MKNLLLLLVCFSLSFSTLAQTSIAQELAINSGLMMDVTGNLRQIKTKIKQIQKKAEVQFSSKQAIIDLEQKYLKEEQDIVNSRNEDNMRLDQLVHHISDKEKLVKEQDLLDLKQMQLTQSIVDFETRMLQIEQHVKTNYVEDFNLRHVSHSASITNYIEELDNIAFD